jgi:hypothetical protein
VIFKIAKYFIFYKQRFVLHDILHVHLTKPVFDYVDNFLNVFYRQIILNWLSAREPAFLYRQIPKYRIVLSQ